MPESRRMKRCLCVDCGHEWEVPHSRGQYPKRCDRCNPTPRTPEEKERRRLERQAATERRRAQRRAEKGRETRQREAARNAERQARRAEAERERRERRRREEERRAEERKQAAQEKALAAAREALASRAAEKRHAEHRDRLNPLWEDDRSLLLLDEIIEAGLRAGELGRPERRDLVRVIKRVGRAEGVKEARAAFLELAACALAMAGGVPIGPAKEPDPEEALRYNSHLPPQAEPPDPPHAERPVEPVAA
jgi:hypothetical protein